MFDQKRIQKEANEIAKSVSETAPKNNTEVQELTYTEMQALTDMVRMVNINSKLISGVVEQMQASLANEGHMIEQIGQLHEHIKTLYKIIDDLAPEYKIIETMAETEEERRAMCDAYMNHGDYATSTTDTEHEKADPLP